MSDHGLEALALIYQTMEAIGAPPGQLAYLEFPLIPKSGSGLRAILSQPGIIRVWEAMQADANTRYPEDNDRPYFGMGKLRSPELLAYVQTARIEAHTAGADAEPDDVAVALQVDGHSYYESFALAVLFGRYRETGGSPVAANFCSTTGGWQELLGYPATLTPLLSFLSVEFLQDLCLIGLCAWLM